MIEIHIFKEKEKEGGKGRRQLGGQWKVQMFLEGEAKTSFSPFSLSPLTNFTSTFFP
jgi:hypothetical protein